MAARARIFQTTTIFLATGTTTAALLIPRKPIYAEAPSSYDDLPQKKPIYGSPQNAPTTPKPAVTTDPLTHTPPTVPEASTPTPTDRLEKQIRRARLWTYDQAVSAEKQFNRGLTWAFRQETNLANTIASLAPAPNTGEQLLPGLIYVLVATMAGSIVSRNRNLLIRGTFPVAVGVTAGWYLIPHTMENTGNLLWEYEKKVPGMTETHSAIAGFTRAAYREISSRSKTAVDWTERQTVDARKKVEDLVSEGR